MSSFGKYEASSNRRETIERICQSPAVQSEFGPQQKQEGGDGITEDSVSKTSKKSLDPEMAQAIEDFNEALKNQGIL